LYIPELFAVSDADEIEFVLSNVRLGCLVTRDVGGFFGTHLPMHFDPARGVLAGHIAKANPHPDREGDGEALVIFQGLDAYVSPNWYPSKFRHGKAVPTWNYEVVHVAGTLTWRREPEWLRDHLTQLTERFERPQAKPWEVTDAPEDFIQGLISGVIGVELAVRDVQVKRKLSQNRSSTDWQGVVAGLLDSSEPGAQSVGTAMANGSVARSGG
jgi:transcriptional regulator